MFSFFDFIVYVSYGFGHDIHDLLDRGFLFELDGIYIGGSQMRRDDDVYVVYSTLS